MDKVLVTGVAGFIGSSVASRFLSEGYSVVGVDDLSSGRIENVPTGLNFIEGNLAKKSTINKIPGDCSKILHLAGQSSGEISFDDPVIDLEKNTISTLNLISFGIENRVERIVYASSMSVYGSVESKPINENHLCRPLSCYGVGKQASEAYLYIFKDKLPFVSMRMFNVYGPGQDMTNLRQGMISIFLSQALEKKEILVKGSVERFRDFIYIDDVVEAWFRAAIYPSALSQIFNVGTGIKITVASLLDQLCELIPDSNYYVDGTTPGDQSGIFADNTKIMNCLELKNFTPLNTGLSAFVDWAIKSK